MHYTTSFSRIYTRPCVIIRTKIYYYYSYYLRPREWTMGPNRLSAARRCATPCRLTGARRSSSQQNRLPRRIGMSTVDVPHTTVVRAHTLPTRLHVRGGNTLRSRAAAQSSSHRLDKSNTHRRHRSRAVSSRG